MPVRSVPGAASVATAVDGKLFAPSAARNLDPLCGVLTTFAPKRGQALELASGTGQHAVGFAARFPALSWQPTEVQPQRLASIDAYAAEAGLSNLRPARQLDATAPGWGHGEAPTDLILLSNLMHLISETEARVLIAEAAQALAIGGRFVIYGPFMRDHKLTSAGDRNFHRTLSDFDPDMGYKDIADVRDWLTGAGLCIVAEAPLPANNLALIAERSAD